MDEGHQATVNVFKQNIYKDIWSVLKRLEFVSPVCLDILCRCEYCTHMNPGVDQTT